MKSGSAANTLSPRCCKMPLASVLPWTDTYPFVLLGGLIASSSPGISGTHGCVWPGWQHKPNSASYPHPLLTPWWASYPSLFSFGPTCSYRLSFQWTIRIGNGIWKCRRQRMTILAIIMAVEQRAQEIHIPALPLTWDRPLNYLCFKSLICQTG